MNEYYAALWERYTQANPGSEWMLTELGTTDLTAMLKAWEGTFQYARVRAEWELAGAQAARGLVADPHSGMTWGDLGMAMGALVALKHKADPVPATLLGWVDRYTEIAMLPVIADLEICADALAEDWDGRIESAPVGVLDLLDEWAVRLAINAVILSAMIARANRLREGK